MGILKLGDMGILKLDDKGILKPYDLGILKLGDMGILKPCAKDWIRDRFCILHKTIPDFIVLLWNWQK